MSIIAATGTEAKVCEDIARRQKIGIAKYGTTVAENPLTKRQWLNHAYEESLDLAVYLRRLMGEMGKPTDSIPSLEIVEKLLSCGYSIAKRSSIYCLLTASGEIEVSGCTMPELLANIMLAEGLE